MRRSRIRITKTEMLSERLARLNEREMVKHSRGNRIRVHKTLEQIRLLAGFGDFIL